MFNLFKFNFTGFNSPVSGNALFITPNDITSDESFGVFEVFCGAAIITPSSITSEEVFGSFSVIPGSVEIITSSIVSDETFGTLSMIMVITPSSITSDEEFESFSVIPGSVTITTSSILSDEAFGSFSVSIGRVTLVASSITSDESFETPTMTMVIDPSSITSEEAFGSFSLVPGRVTITTSSIVSDETFGTLRMIMVIEPVIGGIPSDEAFGSFSVIPGSVTLTASSIVSNESFGTFTITMTIKPSFITSEEAFGSFSVIPGSVEIIVNSIISSERFRRPVLKIRTAVPSTSPIIYNKLATSFLGYGLAILENAKDICIHEVLNGEYTLKFALPINDSKWEYIAEENIVKVEGQLFVIRSISDAHGENQLCTVNCEHVFFLLLDDYIEYLELTGNATYAVNEVLQGTGHSIGRVDVAGAIEEVVIENQNPIKAINTIISTLGGGELKVDNWDVDLLAHRGSTTPNIQFRYRKNIKSINRTVDTSGLITRLYVYGNDGLTIEDATEGDGKKYIDSQYINSYRRPKTGSIQFDIDDVEELYAAGVKHLAKVDVPFVTYEVDVLELKTLLEYGDLETFVLGDECMVIDEVLGINVQARILDYEWYPMEPANSRVVLANFRPGIQSVLDPLNDLKNNLITEDGNVKIKTNWFEGVINTLQNQLVASGSYATAQVIDGIGMLFENVDINSNDYGAVYIGPGILSIAKEKTGSPPVWDWRTFGTGKGFTGDLITAGKVKAEFIQVGDETEFAEGYNPSTANTVINGWKYTGTTKINGGQIQTDSIEAAAIKTGSLIVGSNVGLGTAVTDGGVVTIVNGTVTADFINALDGIILGIGASIDWGVGGVNAPSASQVGARPYDWIPAYGDITGTKPPSDADNTYTIVGSRLTHIDGEGIYTGTLTAQQINAIQGIMLGAGASIDWAAVTPPSYSNITGTKPPSNADNTTTIIGSSRLTHIDGEGIYTGTLTGNVIQTAASGNRIVLNSNSLSTYVSTGLRGISWGTGVGSSYGDVSFYDDGVETMRFYNALGHGGWDIYAPTGSLGLGYSGKQVLALGNWNFSNATVSYLHAQWG